MKLELLPLIDRMLEIYKLPLNTRRFEAYLNLLQGGKKENLVVPASSFNPMAKEETVEKLRELQRLQAEEIIQETLDELHRLPVFEQLEETFTLALNLADDVRGGWTNRFTSDYDSKFKTGALLERKFVVVIFWTGETYSPDLIRERTREYALRALYASKHPKPTSLWQHVEQEKFVARHVRTKKESDLNIEKLQEYFEKHSQSEDYALIFNFLYGDEASQSLEFSTFGISGIEAGFKYARFLGLTNSPEHND